ncbi:MAG: NADH-quinone oxidoreductase subunit NuoN [Zetaproteobacteria bacterium]|nr:MAG: NADH-quinone oxidoreductase subunit NuoN [Zetaproteobacteria bacterium]
MGDLNIMLILPEIFLALTGMGFLMLGVFQGNRSTDVLCWSACVSFIIAAVLLLKLDWSTQYILNDMLVIDQFSSVMKLLILLGLTTSLILSVQYLYQERIARFEYPVLVVFAGIGMMLMVSANNFLSLYMALELQSLALYVLAAFHRNSLRSGEAATKYFILGALSSGMLLFGISLIYGFVGSVDFATVQNTLSNLEMIPPGFIIGMVFVIVAMAFKISAVPFHMWTPDVYEGAPSCVTALFAIVPKIAALGLLIRLLYGPFAPAADQWMQILYFMAIASLVVGSFAAIAQDNIKRLFAYSSIGNMGYALIGIVAGTSQGVGAVLVFLFIYMAMISGSFSIILYMRRNGMAVEKISDLAGFSSNNPVLAYAMAILMFSMSGIPPLAGFFGKLFIFQAAIDSELYVLATLGIMASVVAAYYYLRIIKVMFFDEAADPFDDKMNFGKRIVLLASMVLIFGFIFSPNMVLDNAMGAAASLF